MALSVLISCSRSAQLALLSMKRTLSSLLRPFLALSLPFFFALLLPRLLSFLFSLLPSLSSLQPAPIFLLANILILAILFSSPSSQSSPQDNSFAARFPPPTCAYHASRYYPSADGLPSAQQQVLTHRCRHAPQPASSDLSMCLVSVSVPCGTQCGVVCASSQRTFSESTAQLSQKLVAPTHAYENIKRSAVKPRSAKELQLTKHLSAKEPAKERVVVSSAIVRSNSDSRICAGEHATACEKSIRRTVTMNNPSVVLRAGCDGNSSSIIVMDVPPIESLMDEDFHKRCAEFIANNYRNWKKESLDCRCRG